MSIFSIVALLIELRPGWLLMAKNQIFRTYLEKGYFQVNYQKNRRMQIFNIQGVLKHTSSKLNINNWLYLRLHSCAFVAVALPQGASL